jgi:cobalt-zinc-cadmium efflux system outer membrane protein
VGCVVLSAYAGGKAKQLPKIVSQLVELGGKRAARTEFARLNQNLANWDYETQRINVLTQVTQAYIAVLVTQQRLLLAEKLLDLAVQVVKISAAKVRSGSVAPLEETKAKVMQASSQIEQQRAQQQLAASSLRLANSWGSTHIREAFQQIYVAESTEKFEGLLNNWYYWATHSQL